MWLSASLALALPPVPPCAEPPAVMLIAGHGAPGNPGNLGVHGQREQDVALELTLDLAARLSPWVRPILGRRPGELPDYDQRLDRLRASDATLLLEIHTDVREGGQVWADSPWGEVVRHDQRPGFSIIYHDHTASQAEGLEPPDRTPPDLGARSGELARALGRALAQAGMTPYTEGYGEQHAPDPVPGVYRDRRGLKMLRRAPVPAVLIETHHALDFDEALAWREPSTHARFAAAVRSAVAGYVGCPEPR